jgi:hypothetical protein
LQETRATVEKVKRWFLLLPVFLAGLFLALHATAAVKETAVDTSIVPIGGGQYRLTVTQRSPDTEIHSFVFVPGSGLTITSVVSVSQPDGSCSVSGRNVSCNVTLMLAPCTCQPGGSVDVTLAGSGDTTGSTLQVNGGTYPVISYPGPTTTTTTATTTAATTTTATTTATTTTTITYPPVRCVVPKLAGKTLAAAKAGLRKAHCGVGKVTRVRSAKVKKGSVVSSTPGAGKSAKAGTPVALHVSRGAK